MKKSVLFLLMAVMAIGVSGQTAESQDYQIPRFTVGDSTDVQALDVIEKNGEIVQVSMKFLDFTPRQVYRGTFTKQQVTLIIKQLRKDLKKAKNYARNAYVYEVDSLGNDLGMGKKDYVAQQVWSIEMQIKAWEKAKKLFTKEE